MGSTDMGTLRHVKIRMRKMMRMEIKMGWESGIYERDWRQEKKILVQDEIEDEGGGAQAEHKTGIGRVSFGFLLHCHLHCLIDFLQLGRRLFAAVGG